MEEEEKKEIVLAFSSCLNHSGHVQISWFAGQEQENSARYRKTIYRATRIPYYCEETNHRRFAAANGRDAKYHLRFGLRTLKTHHESTQSEKVCSVNNNREFFNVILFPGISSDVGASA